MGPPRPFVVCEQCPDGWLYLDRMQKKKGLCKCGKPFPEAAVSWARAKQQKAKAKAKAKGKGKEQGTVPRSPLELWTHVL